MGLALAFAPLCAQAAAPPVVISPAPATGAPAAPIVNAQPPVPTLAQTLATEETALSGLQDRAQATSNDAQLASLAAKAARIEAQAREAGAGPAAQVADLQAKIARIMPPRRRRPSAIQRSAAAPLEAELVTSEAALRRARQTLADAQATYNLIAERRREGFSARVLTRSDSPLSPSFWASLGSAAAGDGGRLTAMLDDEASAVKHAPEPRAALTLAAAIALAALLVLVARPWLERLGRLGRSAHADFERTGWVLWVAVVDTGAPTLAAAVTLLGAQWGGLLSNQADSLAQAAIVAVAWASAVLAVGRALATEEDPRERLAPISDQDGRRLRAPILAVAVVTAVGFMLTRLNYVIGASVAATITSNCLVSIAYALVAGMILVSFGGGVATDASAADRARAPVWTLVSLVLTAAIIVTLGAVILGYSTLAAMVSGQIFWLSFIGAVAFLLMRFADDFCAALFSTRGWAARALLVLFGFRRSIIAQAGALVSAALQIVILFSALSFALTPFGRGGDLLFSHLGELGRPIRFGSAAVSPGAIAAGVFTFVVGVGLARFVQHWVERRYLPATDWDAGVRNSVVTGVGYTGVAVALFSALAAAGLGLSQLALVASALSVGIGFGLQQIVQNFVSGVILLVERPVKVGDRVNIDGVEGDIRRIRVRATEIAISDRSTVIVPNSDFITKQVQNKTLGDLGGRVQLQLSLNRPADVAKARELILAAVKARPEVAQDPPAEVFIDSLAPAGAVNLICHLYVDDARTAFRVRSACYFAILEAFQASGIAFAGVG